METWFSRGQAPEEILRVAEEVGCDLIVMGTHGRTGTGPPLDGQHGRVCPARGETAR